MRKKLRIYLPFAFVAYLPATYFLGKGGFFGAGSSNVGVSIVLTPLLFNYFFVLRFNILLN